MAVPAEHLVIPHADWSAPADHDTGITFRLAGRWGRGRTGPAGGGGRYGRVLGLIGFVFPILWLIGALLPTRRYH